MSPTLPGPADRYFEDAEGNPVDIGRSSRPALATQCASCGGERGSVRWLEVDGRSRLAFLCLDCGATTVTNRPSRDS